MNTIKKYTILFLAAFLLLAGRESAYSLPTVDNVAGGDVKVEMINPTTMNITASDNAIVNYSSFSIMQNESVYVNLPSADSRMLNRVTGNDPSRILGNLSCNGVFILVNPAGIHVGPNANINAAGIVMSTRDISNRDFTGGNYIFQKLSKREQDTLLLNEGRITIKEGGFGVLIAGAIENRGIIIAPAGKIVLAGGDAIKLGISRNGLISIAILEKTASTIMDSEGKPITDQIKNTGTLEAAGGTVTLRAESLPNIFEKAINLEGCVRAARVENKDGVIRIVADGNVTVNAGVQATKVEIGSAEEAVPENVTIEGAGMNAEDSVKVIANNDIEVKANVSAATGDITLFADHDGNGAGNFVQTAAGVIEAKGAGNVVIDGSGDMTLGEIRTERGAIMIGQSRTPSAILGSPYYVHTQGDLTVTTVEEGDAVTVLGTSRGDILRYATGGKVTLEAVNGKVVELASQALPGEYLKVIANEIWLNSKAAATHVIDNDSDLYIETLIEVSPNVVCFEGAGTGKVTYLKTNNITLDAGSRDIVAAPGVVIPGNQVKLAGYHIGSVDNPVGINANTTYINRLDGDIDVLEMVGIGSSICIRGPAPGNSPDAWGAVTYNRDSYLVLDATKVKLTGPDPVYLQGNITFSSLECVVPGKEIYFEAGMTYTIPGGLTIRGAEGGLIKLVSSREGAAWNIDPRGTRDITYVWVKDSNNLDPAEIFMTQSTNRGNCYNWDAVRTWTGLGADNNWTTPANWDALPVANDDLWFPNGASRMTTSYNNFAAGTAFASIQFTGASGGYILSGNQITLGTGGITSSNTSWTNTIALAVDMAATRTVTVSSGGTLTISAVISGAGGLTKGGAGTLTLSGANTYSGGTALNLGMLISNNASALGSAGNITFNGGTLRLAVAQDISSRIKNSASDVKIDTGGNTVTFAGVIDLSNTGGLTKTGAGTLVLSNANTYAGLTTVSGGILNIRNGSALGDTSTGTVVAGGASLQLQGGITVGNEALTLYSMSATGGTETTVGDYHIHTFTSNGTFTVSDAGSPEALLVGGGGGGGSALNTGSGGGGGAGEAYETSFDVGVQPYAITVGTGGAGGIGPSYGSNGNTTSFDTLKTVLGGGGGGHGNPYDGLSGACGGGAGGSGGTSRNGGIGSPGYNGGANRPGGFKPAGGGGGMTAVGQQPVNTSTGGAGGAGLTSSMSGSSQQYAGGGGGGTRSRDPGSVGGTGVYGGGNGASYNVSATSGADNTGGGGGGGSGTNGGNGGSGIVILRYNTVALKNVSGDNVWQGTVTLGNSSQIGSDAGSLTFNTAVNSITAANQNLTVSGAGNVTVTGTITTGTGSVTKSGAGTLTLSGTNTYSGVTTINAGTLSVGAGSTSGSIAGASIVNNSSLIFNRSDAYSYSGIISGIGAVTKTGTGTFNLSGTNTYTGATTVQNGTLRLGAGNAINAVSTTSVTATGAGVTALLDLNGYDLTLTNVLTLGGTTTTSTANVSTGAGTLTANGGITYDAANNPLGSTISGKVSLGGTTRTFTVGDSSSAANDLTVSAVVSGTGSEGLTKSGAGTLVLSGANTYDGLTTVGQGVVNVRNDSALGSTAAGTTVTAGASLEIQGGITIGSEALTLNGTGIALAGVLRNVSGTNTYNGAITLGSDSLITAAAGTLNVGGTVNGANSLVVDAGSGAINLNGIVGGTARLVNLDASGAVGLGAALNISGNLTNNGVWTSNANAIDIDGNFSNIFGAVFNASSSTMNVGGDFTNAGTFNHNNGTVVFDGAGAVNMTGSTVFNNFTCRIPGKTLLFKEGQTFAIDGTLTLDGVSGQDIVLNSQDGVTQFIFKVANLETVNYLDVSNSGVDDTGDNIKAFNSINRFNNDIGPGGSYWIFVPPPSPAPPPITLQDAAGIAAALGDTIFYNLSCDTNGKRVFFEAVSRWLDQGTLTLTGLADYPTFLFGTANTDTWRINAWGVGGEEFVNTGCKF